MEITNEMKMRLAELIFEYIDLNFDQVHLSGNLTSTMNIYTEIQQDLDPETGETIASEKIIIDIPAPRYSIPKYLKTGVIVYNGKGSYANVVNKYGGFTGVHKNYVENAIELAISQWLREYDLKGTVS
jgi:hypothetical protein